MARVDRSFLFRPIVLPWKTEVVIVVTLRISKYAGLLGTSFKREYCSHSAGSESDSNKFRFRRACHADTPSWGASFMELGAQELTVA